MSIVRMTTVTFDYTDNDDDSKDRLRAVRAHARWELGDPAWADRLLHTFFASDPKREAYLVVGRDDFEEVWQDVYRL